MGPARHLRGLTALLISAALLLSAAIPAARGQEETEDEEEFNYIPGDANGPEDWGSIKPEWANCSAGRMQSPIDLARERVSLVPALGFLNHSYRPAEASIVNRGHDIMVRFNGDAGRLVINGTAYELRQMHWHSPSEHTVDGRRYAMELHMVHESAAGKAAVIGILYEMGVPDLPDPFLLWLEPFIRRIADRKDREEPIGVVDPRLARGTASAYYRYMGSLTTPPCSEGVVWTIIKKVRSVSKRQLELLREAVHDGNENNARPVQDLNDRNISLFHLKLHKHELLSF